MGNTLYERRAMNKKDIFREMLIDDERILEKVVEKAKQVFKIDKSGTVIFLVSQAKLTQRQEIAMQLLAKYIASELEIADSDTMTANELADIAEPDKASVNARLHELKKERVAESPQRGHFRISILGVERILDEILADA
jgi:hypothetical protein